MIIVEMTVEGAKTEEETIVDVKKWEVTVMTTVVGTIVDSIMTVGMRRDIIEVMIVATLTVVETVIVTILPDERVSNGDVRAGNERFWKGDYLICYPSLWLVKLAKIKP